ncbi:MAG: monovalent cation/H(+) antiporter subunit G [Alphaproteobacteria bacterium]|nr:monovalent cation/H(+) antiporter subunit G [Alphaproteobacteria bacterium]
MIELLTAAFVVAGGLFAFAAALGVLRLPDVLIRMHASTKAGTLGCGLILVAVAVHFGEAGIVARAIAAIVFLLLTAPVAAHMIGRAAYRTGVPLWRGTVIDELAQSRPKTRKP